MNEHPTVATVPEYIRSLKPYLPGKPIEELQREYGVTNAIKLASNENPLGPSPKAVAAMQAVLSGVHRYPDDGGYELVQRLAAYLDVAPESIVLGNGSDELLTMLARAFLRPGDNALIPQPSFLMYEPVVRWAGATCRFIPLNKMVIDLSALKNCIDGRSRLIFLCNPNNPTGTIIDRHAFEAFLERVPPYAVIVIDEAYGEFVRSNDFFKGADYIDSDRAVVTLKTFSKIYGLAGLRIGYGLMAPDIAQILHRVRIPFNVNIPAQAAAIAALDDTAFREQTLTMIHSGLDFITKKLDKIGLSHFPTQANFLLIDVKQSANDLYEEMLRQGVIVRSMAAYGYPHYIRVNIGLPEENEKFIEALSRIV